MTSSTDLKSRGWDGRSFARLSLGNWRKYLEDYGVTEERYRRKVNELRTNGMVDDPSTEAVWRLIYEINLAALRAGDDALMESTYRTLALMNYDSGEDPKSMVELGMQYQLIQLDESSSLHTKYSRVELVPGCSSCPPGPIVFEISVARALIPIPCKRCRNRTDEEHPYGLCECVWRPYLG